LIALDYFAGQKCEERESESGCLEREEADNWIVTEGDMVVQAMNWCSLKYTAILRIQVLKLNGNCF
jgi:hypothetical protein